MAGTIVAGTAGLLLTGAAHLARRRSPTHTQAGHKRHIDWLLGMTAVSFATAVAADVVT